MRARELERLVWREIERFAESPGKVVGLLTKARATRAAVGGEGAAAKIERQIAARRRERERVITWARQGRITPEEMDAQLARLRAEIAALEAERAQADLARKAAESAAERLKDAEVFLNDLARRVSTLSDEERARIIRQLVPRVIVTPGEGRKALVSATYAFAPPPETYTWNCPASSNSLT